MPSNPLPSSARSALREAAATLQKALDWREAEREKDPLSLDYDRASLAVVEERRAYQTLCHPKSILALLSLAERGAEDTGRLTRLMALVYEGEETCAWLRTMDAMALTITLDAYTNNVLASSPTGGTTG